MADPLTSVMKEFLRKRAVDLGLVNTEKMGEKEAERAVEEYLENLSVSDLENLLHDSNVLAGFPLGTVIPMNVARAASTGALRERALLMGVTNTASLDREALIAMFGQPEKPVEVAPPPPPPWVPDRPILPISTLEDNYFTDGAHVYDADGAHGQYILRMVKRDYFKEQEEAKAAKKASKAKAKVKAGEPETEPDEQAPDE